MLTSSVASVPTNLRTAIDPLSLVGSSDAVRAARAELATAAGRRDPILLIGEPGLRLPEVARYAHAVARNGRPFNEVDCAAGDPRDLETHLFGNIAGRMDADPFETVTRDAAVASVADGTLFLDNIDELPASAQRRLVRIIRDSEMRVEGEPDRLVARLRIVAATSADLQNDAREGRFRQDLLRRLSAAQVVIPAFRQRPSDVPLIAARLAADMGREGIAFTEPAATVLSALPWTRNVDELSGLLQRVLQRTGDLVRQEDVLAELPIQSGFAKVDLSASLREARRRFEREYIAAVLERHQWRMAEAAKILGIERANLYRKTRQLGIARATRTDTAGQGR